MASREGDEPKSGPTPMGRVPMLPADNSKVNWVRQQILMNAYFKRRPGAEAIFKKALPTGTEARVEGFRDKYQIRNDFVYSVLVEMCTENETALNQVQEMATKDPRCWANMTHFG